MLNSTTTSIAKDKLTGKNSTARSDHSAWHLPTVSQKIQPVDSKTELLSSMHSNVTFQDSLPSMPLKQHTTVLPSARTTNYNLYKSKTEEFTTSRTRESPPNSNENFISLQEVQDAHGGCSKWFNGLTSTQQILFRITMATLVTLAVASAVGLPLYFVVFSPKQSEASFTNMTVSACASTTCIGQETPYRSSIATTLFTFNGNTADQSGYVTGAVFGGGGVSYAQGYIAQALYLLLTPLQYVQVLNLNLAQQSFTIETWFYVPSFASSNDFGLFGQCDAYNVCMSLSIRNSRFTFSLNSMNTSNITLTGGSVIAPATYYHVAIVYDAIQYQQLIYVNGQIDAVSNGIVGAYQGNPASVITTIGKSSSFAYPNSYFYGRINQFTISAGSARSACEILNDASVIVYYPFSSIDTFNDYGVNLCNGIASGTTLVSSGRIGQALSFTSNASYFQSQCFPRMRANYYAFTISVWINPISTTGGGSIVHMSSQSNGSGICYDLLGLTSSGAIVTQWLLTAASVSGTSGSIIPANTWTHIAVVYQSTNGVRLYVNGQYSSASLNTAAFNIYEQGAAPAPWYMTLGNISPLGASTPVNCLSGSVPTAAGAFPGQIDEFRAYNRDLNNEEICVLANP